MPYELHEIREKLTCPNRDVQELADKVAELLQELWELIDMLEGQLFDLDGRLTALERHLGLERGMKAPEVWGM